MVKYIIEKTPKSGYTDSKYNWDIFKWWKIYTPDNKNWKLLSLEFKQIVSNLTDNSIALKFKLVYSSLKLN